LASSEATSGNKQAFSVEVFQCFIFSLSEEGAAVAEMPTKSDVEYNKYY